jgi:hypothetical protein
MEDDKQLCHSTGTAGVNTSATTMAPCVPAAPHYPAHFKKGSIIQLASGELKRVEDLTAFDFVRSAEISSNLCIDTSIVENITPVPERDTVMLTFRVGPQQVQVSVESTVEHPFFVYDRGWSSHSPLRTLQRYQLNCQQLTVGDKCISLTQKKPDVRQCVNTQNFTVRNGSLAASTTLASTTTDSGLLDTTRICSLSTVPHQDGRLRLASDSVATSYFSRRS